VVARRNLAGSPIAPSLFTGSLRSVRSSAVAVLVANLNAATIDTLAAEMMRVTRQSIIVSGFRADEATRVAKTIGKPMKDELELDDWSCLIF
jgi:ribosomal protein L11 methylase PrmA